MDNNDNNQNVDDNNSRNRMNKWQDLIDERIRKVIGNGDMSWHPGAGQPLQLDDDSLVPEDERLSHKVMKDNDAVPAWMSLGFVLRDKQEKIVRRVAQFARDYVKRSRDAVNAASFVREQEIRKRWLEACQRLRQEVKDYNSELLNYNLQIPPSINQMIPLNAEELIEKSLKNAERESQQ
jgi:hypothetical protein